ncbi:MAG: hypothetical protein QNJ54_17905 [Prochloraceae cyanobacterium]|nr:hypothetical protein [Prochloraceae cyanobacterium]
MIETLTAAAIAKLVFDGVIQAGAGKLTEAGLEKGKQLWQKMRGKVKEEGVTEAVLVEVEKNKSSKILEEQIVPFLQVAMLKDPQFAQEIQNIAQQINLEIQQGSKDNIQVSAISHDKSTQNVVLQPKAKTQTFVTHYHEKK